MGVGVKGNEKMLVKGYKVAIMQDKSRGLMYRHDDYT